MQVFCVHTHWLWFKFFLIFINMSAQCACTLMLLWCTHTVHWYWSVSTGHCVQLAVQPQSGQWRAGHSSCGQQAPATWYVELLLWVLAGDVVATVVKNSLVLISVRGKWEMGGGRGGSRTYFWLTNLPNQPESCKNCKKYFFGYSGYSLEHP